MYWLVPMVVVVRLGVVMVDDWGCAGWLLNWVLV